MGLQATTREAMLQVEIHKTRMRDLHLKPLLRQLSLCRRGQMVGMTLVHPQLRPQLLIHGKIEWTLSGAKWKKLVAHQEQMPPPLQQVQRWLGNPHLVLMTMTKMMRTWSTKVFKAKNLTRGAERLQR